MIAGPNAKIHQSGSKQLRSVVLRLARIRSACAGSSWAGQAGKVTRLTNDEVTNLTTSAKTASDHGRLAQHFTAKAEAYEAEAQEHEDLAAQYRQTPNPNETKHLGSPRTSAHCYQAASGPPRSAQNARQLANEHMEMGKSASN